ncbi:MAG: hypothetical protein GX556_09290, partial [Fibrobacter sp.]|nr:hypothetical protein [Fibrobacter sp.]
VFDNGAGGGITAMTDSVHGQSSSGQGNQIGAGQNLYYFSYGGEASKTNGKGSWSVLQDRGFYAIIRQSGTLNGLPYTTDYTIHGSGKIYIKTTLSNTGGDVSGKTVMCVAERKSVATMSALSGNSTASLSPYVLLSSNSAGHSDILLSIKDLWNTSNGAANSATGFYSNASSGYTGYEHNSYSLNAGQKQVWEFMLDFVHDCWNDTLGVGEVSDDYRSPDSLEMIAGTLLMEKSWEKHLRGHWKMDEGAGDTIRDNSGNKRHAKTTGTWASGRWSGALGLNGSQSATYPDNADFDGTDFFTVMAWVKTNTGAFTASSVVAGKINGSNGWKLTGNGSDQVVLTCNGTSVTGTRDVGDGSWHHVATCFSPSKVILYVDGRLDKISTGTYSVTANDNALVIGNGLTGTLDDVRYYHDYISENTLKAIYQQGFRSSEGFYELRADNNGSISLKIDGGSISRNFPVFLINNYWAETKPAAGCVVLNGASLNEDTDYHVHFDNQNNQLIIGLNKIISSDEACLYIDNDFEDGHMMSGETKKMSWGVVDAGDYDHFWVKNFSRTNFGGSTSNEWYVNWKMVKGTDNKSKDGEIWHMASSVKNPGIAADTTSTTNLIPGGDSWYSTMGNLNFKLGTAESKSSEDVTNAFTYAVEESSSVRVLLRVNERKVSDNLQFKVVTRWAVYPTGQFFRSDSIYQQEVVPSFCYFGLYMDDQTNASIYMNKNRMRAGVIYSSGLPDFATCWLSFKNDGGYQQYPFDSDTITSVKDNGRVGIDYYDGSPSALWNSLSIQTAYYFDMQKSDMSNGFVDSVANGVQFIGTSGGAALNVSTGTLLSGASAAAGDLNGDGFNEREGAYVIEASDNTVNFKIPARNDTCRFYPAFRLTKYYASNSPQYIFLYNSSGDTVPLLEGYQYNAWVNRINRELVVQIDSVFCDSVGIFISADRTLAVTLSEFWARGGQNCDTIGWRTESENENLGYNLYRRVKPSFFDSLNTLKGKKGAADGAVVLLKEKALNSGDTGWVLLNDEIIPGAPSGLSHGSRDYTWIDKNVYNNVLYEYKLVSVDYKNATEEFGPVEAMPSGLARIYHLGANFPNPFRRFTVIRFELPVECRVTLNIYNLQGRLVRRLITPDKPLRADSHQITWDGKNDMGRQLEAGPYVYRITAGRFTKSRVMIMLE